MPRSPDCGLNSIANYIFGLPDDSRQPMQATYDLALQFNCEFATFYSAMAYPGSPLYGDAIAQGIPLPDSWKDFSQHGYNALPMSNEHCSAAEILEFRDRAFEAHYAHQPYLDMVNEKFGQEVVDHIERMAAIPLSRKLLDGRNAA